MPSSIAFSIVTGLSVLSLVLFAPGCGGGCGGAGAQTEELLEKLPASVDGLVVIDVKRTISKEQIEAIIDAAGGAEIKAKIPAWVSSVTHIAVVADWAGDNEAPAPDCDAGTDRVVELMKKEMGDAATEDSLARIRKDMFKACKSMPGLAACMMKVEKFSDMGNCASAEGGGRDRQPVAGILIGDFKASDIVAEFGKMSSGGGPAQGLDHVVDDKAFTSLGDNVVAAGDLKLVLELKAAWDGKADRLKDDSELMQALSKVDKGGSIVAAGHALTKMQRGAPTEAAALSLNFDDKSEMRYWMKADEAMVKEAKAGLGKLKVGIALVDAKMLGGMSGIEDLKTVEKLLGTAKSFIESVEIESADEGVMITGEMDMSMAEYLGIVTPIATAAFIKYMRRAKTSEAIEQIDKIYKGAAVYFMTPMAGRDGALLPCQFPKSVVCTPTTKPCDSGKRYPAATAGTWADPSWAALSFEMTDSHYFQYCFESSGTGSNAKFTVTAHGDLDCDGKLSTFSRSARGVDAGNGECSIKSVGRLYKKDETE